MDIFTTLNRRNIQDRQVDTLIGISKGLLADGKIDQKEAEFLLSWLIQNRRVNANPVIANLLEKVESVLDDGILDEDEAADLFKILSKITGDKAEIGELAKTSNIPVCYPAPQIDFQGSTFLFTGTCAFGTRKQCTDAVQAKGGVIAKNVTMSLNYLVIGTYVTDSWAHETFGRKIEKAVEYRNNGIPISIVSEKHWLTESQLI